MAQTLLAVLALSLVSFLAFNASQERVSRISKAIDGALEVEARGVATEVLDHIGGFPFDGNTTATTPGGFTPEAEFGPPGRDFNDPGMGDIDDFHAVNTHTIERAVLDPNSGEQRFLFFDVGVEVGYVTVTDTQVVSSNGTTTYVKQVVVTVSNPRMIAQVSLSSVIAFTN